MNVLVTIGIPFYNAEEFLEYSIKSVLNQTCSNWELILTDDGSTDRSVDIARKYLNDSRIRLMEDGENRGLPYRLNQQIGLAKGKYFARMDADDIMHPERIQRQVEYLEENKNVDVVGSIAYSIDNNNNILGLLKTPASPRTLNDVFYNRCLIHPTVTAKLDWYRNNLYDMNQIRIEDKELWARTIMHSTFVNLQIPLLYYRDTGIPVVSKYLKGTKYAIALIKKTFKGRQILIRWKFCIRTYIKSSIMFFLSIFKQEKLLIKRRSINIIDHEKQEAYGSLCKALMKEAEN